jgi:hypothetical protein
MVFRWVVILVVLAVLSLDSGDVAVAYSTADPDSA